MPKKEAEPLEKETVLLFKGDMEKLQTLHPEIGASKVIRNLVRSYISKIEAKIPQAELPQVAPPGG